MWAEGSLWGELCAKPLHPRLVDPVGALEFDTLEEAVWAGTSSTLGQLLCPSLDRYCSVPAPGQVMEIRSLGEAAVSLSAFELAVHASGGAPRLSYSDEVGGGQLPGWCLGLACYTRKLHDVA